VFTEIVLEDASAVRNPPGLKPVTVGDAPRVKIRLVVPEAVGMFVMGEVGELWKKEPADVPF
jgi:hypothetical protein